VLIEASEESGSIHLPKHLEALGDQIGDPSLVVCLDAECGNYEQVWCTTSLRGNLVGTLRVKVLTEGVHSGMATGIAPTPFRIVQQLLARIENAVTGDILLDALQVTIPKDRRAQIAAAAQVLGGAVAGKIPFIRGVQPVSNDPTELLINSTWRSTLAVTGAGGTIPFMGMLGERFPKTQFFVTGVLGPQSNAHGPNEFLHIDYAKKLTACVAHVLKDHATQFTESGRT
jgi:acetylornithine deacetylase/succinyl-diaminopimelate desuccinylase-like protein